MEIIMHRTVLVNKLLLNPPVGVMVRNMTRSNIFYS